LSPQQILKGLRKINTLLSIRMNLHERVPPSLREFAISSGKVIFYVRDEFELELSIANEDPSSQLYFIDFRFAFSPAVAEIPSGRLRDEIEGRTNDILKREGLAGCFDFLHDLVLTHKLTILKSQAVELAKGLWSENLRVEAVHRFLVVQYWSNRPGRKNWMEIGIKRQKGRAEAHVWRRHDVPHIALRWFQSGKLVTDGHIDVDTNKISFEKILKQVIAAHTTQVLQEMAVRLADGLLYSERILKLKHIGSSSEPHNAYLLVQLTPSKAIKIVQEPVTGKFALLPASALYNRAEQGLNTLPNPGVEAPLRIANLRSIASQQEVELFAHGIGWEKANSIDPGQELVRRHFPRDTLKFGFFKRPNWGSWVLAFTTSLMGDSWWIVELERRKGEAEMGNSTQNLTQATNRSPKVVFKIPMRGLKLLVTDASYVTLAEIERIAVGMISKYVDARHLVYEKIRHQFGRSGANRSEAESAVLHMRLNRKRSPAMLQTGSSMDLPWINEIITLAFQGLDPMTNFATHTASGRLKTPVANINRLTSAIDRSVAFHPDSGAFAFRVLSQVGDSTVPLVIQRLSSIDRLIYFLNAIKTHKLSLHAMSLNHVEFVYASSPSPLKAKLYFPPDAPQRISLAEDNPHLRIQDFISSIICSSDGLSYAIRLLGLTLPLLRALARLEASYPSEQFTILPRSAEWYEVRYQCPSGWYDFKLRVRRDENTWMVRDRTVYNAEQKNEQIAVGMKRLERATAEGWRGMRDGIAASITGVEELVGKIDELYRSARKVQEGQVGMGPSSRKRKAEDEITALD
jgi:mediator of RNA polymerase II transcription subunit 14